MTRVSAIIVAAGTASRMEGTDKQLLKLNNIPVFIHSILAFDSLDEVTETILVVREDMLSCMKQALEEYDFNKPILLICGGDTRQDSVKNGILACSSNTDYVAVHDGARPLICPNDIERVINDAVTYRASTLGVPAKDTIKLADKNQMIQSTPPREFLYQIQTPQVFEKELYLQALKSAEAKGTIFTDDCQLVEAIGNVVHITVGDYSNIKITTPEDIPVALALLNYEKTQEVQTMIRIGHGYDVHQLAPNRKLIIGGVEIPHHLGLLGHSDADVLLHAISDALLGAAALGDIGKHFPDSDERFRGADSLKLLKCIVSLLDQQGFKIQNIDSTILAQNPKLAPHIISMREQIAFACDVSISQISVKATTEEKLGFTGTEQGIAAHAVVLIESH